jgi:putative transposase
MRKYYLVDGGIYHIFTKSIAGFEIFRRRADYERMRGLLKYYQVENPPLKFSIFMGLKDREDYYQRHLSGRDKLVEIITYCLMPTHLHLVLSQLKANGISTFMGNVLNGYSRYFNIKNKRKGPLWESRFKNVEVNNDKQLLHLTRYIHLNPCTAHLVERPEDWRFSSYSEYTGGAGKGENLCHYSGHMEIDPKDYREFVCSRRDYQRELAEIKDLCFE